MSTRELKPQEVLTAHNLCIAQANKNPTHQFIVNGCPTCRADIVRLVDASPSETTGREVVDGALEWLKDADSEASDIERRCDDKDYDLNADRLTLSCMAAHAAQCVRQAAANLRALLLYSAPPAGDGVPEVTEEDVAHYKGGCSYDPDTDCESCDRILAALSYCATRQGECEHRWTQPHPKSVQICEKCGTALFEGNITTGTAPTPSTQGPK